MAVSAPGLAVLLAIVSGAVSAVPGQNITSPYPSGNVSGAGLAVPGQNITSLSEFGNAVSAIPGQNITSPSQFGNAVSAIPGQNITSPSQFGNAVSALPGENVTSPSQFGTVVSAIPGQNITSPSPSGNVSSNQTQPSSLAFEIEAIAFASPVVDAAAAATSSVSTDCSATNPCTIGCCSPFGFCGYGPSFCSAASNCIPAGSEGGSCNHLSECDPGTYPGWGVVWGPTYAGAEHCPLNVCCSQFGFCGTTVDFCGTATVAQPSCGGTSSLSRTIGYYEGWSETRPCDQMPPSEIPIGAYTHLLYGFLSLDPNSFEVVAATPEEVAIFPQFTALKNDKAGLEVWLSIGGWAFTDWPGPTTYTFSDLVASSSAQASFFASLLSFMSQYGFDGVDMDWEYPVTPDRNGTAADYGNYVTFMQNLRGALSGANPAYGLSMTLPSSYYYMQNFDIVALADVVDWFNVMTYDLHGTWDAGDPFIGNLMLAHTNLTEIIQTMDLLWLNNIDPAKVTMGYGFYGRSFTASDPSCLAVACPFSAGGNPGPCTQSSGTLSYTEIEAILSDPSNNAVMTLDEAAAVQIVTWDTNQWVSFDNQETLEMKQAYANSRCIGGQMVWAVSLDTGGIAAGFLTNSTNEFPQGSNGTSNGTSSNGDVYVPPTIWETPHPSVACLPPCTFILPPVPLSTPTVMVWPDFTTTLLSSSAGVIVSITTTITVDPFTVSSIPLWPVTVVGSDTSRATFTPLQSVTPPAITLTVPGSIAPVPVSSFQYTVITKGSTVPVPTPGQSDTPGQAPSPVSTPSPIQTGTVSGCTQFYEIVSGDSCDAIAAKFGVTDSNLEAWNPAIGSDCTLLFIGFYICVGVGGSGSGGAPTQPSNPNGPSAVQTPSPIQTGMVSGCTQFYDVVSGDSCNAIAAKFGITDSNLETWNPAIGSDCTLLFVGFYICVGVGSSGGAPTQPSNPNGPSAVQTPSPIQTGMVSGCTQFYDVVSGDSCNAIAAKFGITDANLEAWNPAIGSDCTLLFIGFYVCVGVGGSGGITTAAPGQSTTPALPGNTQGAGTNPSASFGPSSHAITIYPEPTISFGFSTTPSAVAYSTGTPENPDPCSGVAGIIGCGAVSCLLFGCGTECGLVGCGGGCGFGFCGGGCGLDGCGPGCGEGECEGPPGAGDGVPPPPPIDTPGCTTLTRTQCTEYVSSYTTLSIPTFITTTNTICYATVGCNVEATTTTTTLSTKTACAIPTLISFVTTYSNAVNVPAGPATYTIDASGNPVGAPSPSTTPRPTSSSSTIPPPKTITTSGEVCVLPYGSNDPECTPISTPTPNPSGTTIHVQNGCISINGSPRCFGSPIFSDTYVVADQNQPESTATIYAGFVTTNSLAENVQPGCELDASWPANYGDIYFSTTTNCLTDSSGNQIQGQCCTKSTTAQITNPYEKSPAASCDRTDDVLAIGFSIYGNGWVSDDGAELKKQVSGCGALAGSWNFGAVSGTQIDGSSANLGTYDAQFEATFTLPDTFKAGCVGRAIASAGGPVGVDC